MTARNQIARIAAVTGGVIVVTAAGIASLTLGVASNIAVQGSMPQATTTVSLPGATITPPAKTLPRATVTKTLPQATKTITLPPKVITKTAPAPRILTCRSGRTEDSCYPDYIGKGRWVLREGERPMPKATKVPRASKRVPGATIAGVCRHPSITKDMVADCNKLAQRPAEVTAAYSNPQGKVLVRECTEQYTGTELMTCLRP